jgi:hypothetical protein
MGAYIVGMFIGLMIGYMLGATREEPCPREALGYKCRRGSSVKCECEK